LDQFSRKYAEAQTSVQHLLDDISNPSAAEATKLKQPVDSPNIQEYKAALTRALEQLQTGEAVKVNRTRITQNAWT
jgi:acetyl-CoA carboxylase beta subunit